MRLRVVGVALLAAALFPGCLTYERSETRVTFDAKTGAARVQINYANIASTEPGRNEQWTDFEQLDSLRRSDAYFANSYLRSPGGGKVAKRRVWIERGRIFATASITTEDLNELSEGWSADSSGYRYSSMLEITDSNGSRTDDEKPTVFWPRSARVLTVSERDPHFREAVPFRAEIRDSLAKRLPKPALRPTRVKRAAAHHGRRAKPPVKRRSARH